MARSNVRTNDNNASVKLVYFEAHNVDGDLAGVIQAFAGAVIRAPTHVIANTPHAPALDRRQQTNDNGASAEREDVGGEEVSDDGADVERSSKREPRDKRPFRGKILDDIPRDGGGM